jgi:hypothetical protein
MATSSAANVKLIAQTRIGGLISGVGERMTID